MSFDFIIKFLNFYLDNTRTVGKYMYWEELEISKLWKDLDNWRVETVTTKWKGNFKRIHFKRNGQGTGLILWFTSVFFFYQMMIKKLQVLSMLSVLNFAVIDRQKIVIWEATRTVLDTGGQILKKLGHCISGGYYKIIWFIATTKSSRGWNFEH